MFEQCGGAYLMISISKGNMTEEDLMKEIGSLEVVKYDVKMRKALDFLKNN